MKEIYDDAVVEVIHAFEHRSRGMKESHPGYLQCYCDYINKNQVTEEMTKETLIKY